MPTLDFGVQIEPQYGFTYTQINEIAQAAERLGYESLWVSDHFFMTPDTVDTNCLECYTVLTALARDTRRLRLGAMVASQSYRNPALLAKVAASLDHISGGRLNFGVGAGWKEVEYRAYGYPFPGPGVRIRQLDEALEVCRRMWADDRASFEGRYYTVRDALSTPKPVQKPLPVWVGAQAPRRCGSRLNTPTPSTSPGASPRRSSASASRCWTATAGRSVGTPRRYGGRLA